MEPRTPLAFATIWIPPDSRRKVSSRLPAEGEPLFPRELFVHESSRSGVKIQNITIQSAGQEVPFFDGQRSFYAELFDGDGTKDVPYGRLPAVPADPGSEVVLEVWNTTLETREFAACLYLLTRKDLPPKP